MQVYYSAEVTVGLWPSEAVHESYHWHVRVAFGVLTVTGRLPLLSAQRHEAS